MPRLIPENPVQNWLRHQYISSSTIHLDNWSLIHFSCGFLLGYLLLLRWKAPHPWGVFFAIILVYEVVEYASGSLLFMPETSADTVWDIVIGTAGFLLFDLFYRYRNKKSRRQSLPTE